MIAIIRHVDRRTLSRLIQLNRREAVERKGMNPMDEKDPWKRMQPYDVRSLGEVILDRKEQERWCRAVLLGGLPFMWRKAEVARNLIYDKLELREGDKELIIGEGIEPCGFVPHMRAGTRAKTPASTSPMRRARTISPKSAAGAVSSRPGSGPTRARFPIPLSIAPLACRVCSVLKTGARLAGKGWGGGSGD